ncbi:MAG TPA: DUF433 domain-containing protein [Pirellulales bacterium]|nr:DUF433 domain-containing protein [Pirellulales bacterium]
MALANQTSPNQRIQDRLRFAAESLRDCVEIDADKRGGIPVIKGTRFPVSQLLGEIADSELLEELADEFGLSYEVIKRLLEGLSVCLDQPLVHDDVPT